ncbi:DUF3014 domain-containing protein [Oleiagrimonas citrea]|uniref:DUF3014 domain-containing protein n=1 Tax=Oleiagrimonas citrea TaxID=1665687 RepID=UPI0030840C26
MSTSNPAKWITMGLLVVVVVAGGGYYLVTHRGHKPAPENLPAPAASTAPAPVSTAPQHPISQAVAPASASTAPLPSLDDSDSLVHEAATRFGGDKAADLLTGKALIPHIVATINALPGRRLPASVLPVHAPRGHFTVTQADGSSAVMAPTNAARYAPYVDALEKADTDQLVAWYVRNYPLFEEAWRQLGYPQKHFNDRLVQVLDLLLATPDPAQPPYLEGAAGVYRFQNPQLENLAVGQKMLLRLGPAREAKVKAKLRAIRAAVTGQQMPATEPAPSASAG